MTAARRTLLLLLRPLFLATLFAGCDAPQPPWSEAPPLALDLRIDVVPTEAALLEPVTVTLDLYRRAGVDVRFEPELDPERFATEAVRRLPERPFGAGFWQRIELVLLPLQGPGPLPLPPFVATSVDGEHSASTPERELTVRSTLAGHGDAVEVVGGPIAAPRAIGAWLWLSGSAVLTAALIVLLLRRRRAQLPAATVAVPPHVLALRELQRLEHAQRASPEQVERFYVQVSAVLRRYVEQRFAVRAPERTTDEFLRELDAADPLLQAQREIVTRFLQRCDLVKFAAAQPGDLEHSDTLSLARQFVEATRDDGEAATPRQPALQEVAP